MRHRPQYLQRVGTAERQPLEFLRDRRVAAFSGIATAESFEKFLRDLGGQLEQTQRFLDHHRFSVADLETIFSRRARPNWIYRDDGEGRRAHTVGL